MKSSLDQVLAERPLLSVGILSADLLDLGGDLSLLAEAGVRIVHVDVMDGCFCPQLTVGPPFIKALAGPFLKDVHLMIEEPLGKLDAYLEAGADLLTFHLEATKHPHRVLQSLAGSGVARGVALNPGTPVSTLAPLLDQLELILLLAVNPGWSGQSFEPATETRLREARGLIGIRDIVLGVDGGITRENAGWVASLGADLIVTGSAVFRERAVVENARAMLEAITPTTVKERPR